MTENIPHDDISERAILGAMLIDDKYVRDVLKTLKADHFNRDPHREIFKAIDKLSQDGTGIDTVTVSSYLKKIDQLKFAGGYDYINGLIDGLPEKLNLKEYIKTITKDYRNRKAVEVFNNLAKRGGDPGSEIEDLINGGIESLQNISEIFQDDEPSLLELVKEKFKNDMARDPNRPKGYKLKKFEKLQKNMDGIQPGTYVIGADTNIGKTSFLLNIMLDLLDVNPEISCLFFNLDDTLTRIINRAMSISTGIELKHIDCKQGDENNQIVYDAEKKKLCDYIETGRLEIVTEFNIDGIKRIVSDAMRKNPRLVVFIDSFNDVGVGDVTGLEADERRAKGIRQLYIRHNIPVLATAELRKDKTQNHRPRIADVLGSVKAVYKAEIVFLLDPENEENFINDPSPTIWVSCAKNKISGFKGVFYLQFKRETTEVFEIEFKKKSEKVKSHRTI